MDVPVNLPQGQIKKCSEKLQNNLRAASQMLPASVNILNVKDL